MQVLVLLASLAAVGHATHAASTALELSFPLDVVPANANATHASINCVCWGLCCTYCRGEGCPQRRLEADDVTKVIDDADAVPLVWANVGANGSAVQCRQRAWGIECPPQDA